MRDLGDNFQRDTTPDPIAQPRQPPDVECTDMRNPFTEHPRETAVPQTYWEHGAFAFRHSAGLVGAGLLGMVHAVFPWMFKFHAAEHVIRTAKILERTGRHAELFAKYSSGVDVVATKRKRHDHGAAIAARLPRLGEGNDNQRAA